MAPEDSSGNLRTQSICRPTEVQRQPWDPQSLSGRPGLFQKKVKSKIRRVLLLSTKALVFLAQPGRPRFPTGRRGTQPLSAGAPRTAMTRHCDRHCPARPGDGGARRGAPVGNESLHSPTLKMHKRPRCRAPRATD